MNAELEATLLRALLKTWRELNHAFFKNALRKPVMRLSSSETILGRWNRVARCIEISRPLMLDAPWGAIVEVLKHEMAHQYAHEVLAAVDEKAHGPAFQQVCARIGIDPAASGVPDVTGQVDEDDEASERHRVLKRVADLLALAQSSNQHEAENAAALAQRLMLKHNIALAEERRRYAFRHLGTPKGRVQEHEHILAAIVADYFFVEAIWVPGYRTDDGKRGNVLEICGTPENLAMAGHVHAFLLGTAERLWKIHKREHDITKNRLRRGYLAGVMEGFRERLESERSRNKEKGPGMGWRRRSRSLLPPAPPVRAERAHRRPRQQRRATTRQTSRSQHRLARRGRRKEGRIAGQTATLRPKLSYP